MAYAAVLDACVLYPASLRDTLLRFAAAEFYDLLWSDRILDEAGARRLRDAMANTFDGAMVPAEAVAGLEDAMTNDPKDRHVLATAVASQAQAASRRISRTFPRPRRRRTGSRFCTLTSC